LRSVALVLGRGGSVEEAKLGEALGLAYLEASLRRSGLNVDIFLTNAIVDAELRAAQTDDFEDARVAARRVAAADPVVCGISLIYRGQQAWTATFAETLKRLAPRCHLTVGGMYPTSAWEILLGSIPAIDSVCVGEGDRVIVRLVELLLSGGDFRTIPELAARSADGTPCAGGKTAAELGLRRPPVAAWIPASELGRLDFPTRGQLDAVLALGGVIQVDGSRGCNAGCTFCEARNTRWRPRPVEHLVAELKVLAGKYPGTLFYMVDNIFLGFSQDGSHLARGREIARQIIAQGIDLRFVIQDRAANVDRETFALLKQAGLCEVYLGIESFADSALRAFRKGTDSSAAGNGRALRLLGELEIYTQFGFLPFHERATFEEIRTSVAGLREACLDNPYLHISNFNELIPYEGTYLARKYEREHGQNPPAENPWNYGDHRVRFIRDWIWRFSLAFWPLTSLVHNSIQYPEYQRYLTATLPVKNGEFLSYVEGILGLAENAPDPATAAEFCQRAVDQARTAISATLATWSPGPARAEMRERLDLVRIQD
jgi:anaerobic magnesium-protoporphyrin IX monomethyl ester cyclase